MRLVRTIDHRAANIGAARNLCLRPRVRNENVSDTLGEDTRVICRVIHFKKAEGPGSSKKKGSLPKLPKGRAPYFILTYVADQAGNMAFIVASDIPAAKKQFAVNFLKNVPQEEMIGIGDWIILFEPSQGKSTRRGEIKLSYDDAFIRVPKQLHPETLIRYDPSADTMTYVAIQQKRFLFEKANVASACAGYMCGGLLYGEEGGKKVEDPCVGVAQKGVKTTALQGDIFIPDLDMRVAFRSTHLRDLIFNPDTWRQASKDIDALRDLVKQTIDQWEQAGPTLIIAWVKPSTPADDDEDNIVSATRCHVVKVVPPSLPLPPPPAVP